jgi:hypothetical protein
MKSFGEVRKRLGGLKGLMTKLGLDPKNGNWKNMPICPFCTRKACAGVYSKGAGEYFHCFKTDCSGHKSMSEIDFISCKEGLSTSQPAEGGASPAYERLLRLAECWEEPPVKKTKASPAKPKPPEPEPPKVLENALPNPVIPPAVEPVPPVRSEPVRFNAAHQPVEPEGDDEEMLMKCIEVIRFDNKVSVSNFQRRLKIGYGRASRMMDELEKRGVVGPHNDQSPRDILKLPDKPIGVMVIALDGQLSIERSSPAPAAAAEVKPVAPVDDQKKKENTTPATPKPEEKPKLALGLAMTRAFFEKLFPTESQISPYLDQGVWLCEKCGIVSAKQCKKCETAARWIESLPDPLPAAIAKKIKFRTVSMFQARGITPISCQVLGLRANPPENETVLEDLAQLFSWEECRASGTWLESDGKRKLPRRPNAQFHGKGQIGKKPERERKGKDDKWVWGFGCPVIIPYFDEAGDVIKLRPHKGGAPSGTISGRPRIYVPRDFKKCADVVEKFYTVVICEGEYKAIAIWQTLGTGALLQVGADGKLLINDPRFEPIGVCALPGISYVTNVEIRMDLERWLREVGARRVIVAFDDEDKSDRPMRQRFDAQRDSRVLAIELAQGLHIETKVCVLPREWRNEKGKADWDGALQKFLVQPQK